MQLVELQAVADRIRAAGWGLAAVTKDDPSVLEAFARERGIAYPLFAGTALIKQVGLIDPAFAADPQRAGAPVPVIVLVDARGKIVGRFFESDRWTLPSVLARVGVAAPAASSWIDAAQVDVRAWTPSLSVRQGQRVSLAVDLRPHAKMHVYAPGKHDYTPVSLRLSASSSVQSLGVDFPEPEMYTFKPLNETVPVYMSPATVFADVLISPDAPARPLVIRGVITTQACDDEICYAAKQTPVEWRLTVERKSAIVSSRGSGAVNQIGSTSQSFLILAS